MAKRPVAHGQRILEIGAGWAWWNLSPVSVGHRVTLSDLNEDAILFAKQRAAHGFADR